MDITVMSNSSEGSPAKSGSVKPIWRKADLEKIRSLLARRSRDALLFELALATDFKAKRLLKIKVWELEGWIKGEAPLIKDGPEPAYGRSRLPETVDKAFLRYLSEFQTGPDEYDFKSRKGDGPLTVPSASRLVGTWFAQAGLKGLNGFLSLRKTRELEVGSQPVETAAKPKTASILPRTNDTMEPVRVATVNETVYRKLEQAIISGQFLPGTRLAAENLARQMKVSTIPVREALARLEVRGLVTIVPQKGAIVIQQSVESINELLEIRLILESAAVERVVPLVSAETINLLKKANNAYEVAWRQANVAKILAASKNFHDCLYRDKQMPNLIKMISQIWDIISPYYHIMFRSQGGKLHTGANYHTKIIEGMQEKNEKKVLCWLEQDLNDARNHVTETFEHLNSERGLF